MYIAWSFMKNKRYLVPVFLLLSAQAAFSMDEQEPLQDDNCTVAIMVQEADDVSTSQTINGSPRKIIGRLNRLEDMAKKNRKGLIVTLFRMEKKGITGSATNIFDPMSPDQAVQIINNGYASSDSIEK